MGLIRARLQGRLRAQGIPSFTWFHDHVLRPQPGGSGMQLLIDLSTVNHSAFFREPEPLHALVAWLAGRLPLGPVRVWSAGCSAGQEPYSLAMMLAELVPTLGPDRLTIWASDLSLEMIRTAARAIYAARELADVPPDRLRRFFLRGRGPRHGLYRVAPEIRRLVTFQHFDLRRSDWPMPGDFDAILCRNVALYFDEAERLSLLERLAGRLRPGGWLVVGRCEILPERPRPLQKCAPSIYRKVPMS
ncbi:MAG: protein-glutamate O-methyltransferase CheR [Isosphaeraceae bacterium]|nr:protein-glutamate O-methyltransferase CheR [Isosphaeraceae bacterium]